MAIKFRKDDYLIVEINGKPKLGMAIMKDRIMLEDGCEDSETTEQVKFKPSDVLACLGKTPKIGASVFGITVEPYIQSQKIKGWGTMHEYRTTEPKEMTTLKKCFAKAYQILEEEKLTAFLPLNNIKLKEPKGSLAGSYTYKQKGEANLDSMLIRSPDLQDKKYLLYVILHEASHGIWFRCVPKDVQAKWIGLYGKRIAISKFTDKQMKRLGMDIAKYNGNLSDYEKEMCEDDDKLIIKEAVSYISRVHKISKKEFGMLMEQPNSTDTIKKLWPTQLDMGKPVPDVSEYSLKNVDEFFAESMAYYLTGKKLPKDITKALTYTIKNCLKDY